MKLLSLVDRLPSSGLDQPSKDAALKSVDELREQIAAGEIECVAFIALGNDNIYQAHYGAWNDVYRLVGALHALGQYLLQIYHVEEMGE